MTAAKSTRSHWESEPTGQVCVAEAVDVTGRVLMRVRVSLSYDMAFDFEQSRSERLEDFKRDVAKTAENMARNAIELHEPE